MVALLADMMRTTSPFKPLMQCETTSSRTHAHAEDNEAFLDDGVIRIVYDARVGVVEYGGRLIERDAVLAYIRLCF